MSDKVGPTQWSSPKFIVVVLPWVVYGGTVGYAKLFSNTLGLHFIWGNVPTPDAALIAKAINRKIGHDAAVE